MALLITSSTTSSRFGESLGINRPPVTRASQVASQQAGIPFQQAGVSTTTTAVSPQPPTVSSAFAQVRTARLALASAGDTKNALDQIEPRLRRMRELAVRASATSDDSTREGLASEFDRLQLEINEIGEKIKFSGKTLLSFVNGTKDPALSGTVKISGTGTVDGRTFVEDFRLLSESAVAAVKGITNVEVSDTRVSSNFVSIDQRDGRIIATRSDILADDTVRTVGSQTIDARKLQQGIQQGQIAILDFEAIGLKTTLDDRFTLGKLDQTFIRTDRLTGAKSDLTAGNRFALDIGDQANAQDAANALDAALARVQAVQRNITLFQNKQNQTIRQSFTSLGGIVGRGRINVIG